MTRSLYFRYRTGVSGLSDAELLLFDRFSSGCGYPLTALYEADFAFHANLSFSHGFSDVRVRALLSRWHGWGWLACEETDRAYYSLTPTGGRVWERERRPLWGRFCADEYWSGGDGPYTPHRGPDQGLLCIASPSRLTAEAFLRMVSACGLYDAPVPGVPERWLVHCPWSGLFWKTLPRVVEVRVVCQAGTEEQTARDWTFYEQSLSWWRTPCELVQLHARGLT